MIIAKLQDTRLIYKNQLFSYIQAKNNWNLKLKTQCISIISPKMIYFIMYGFGFKAHPSPWVFHEAQFPKSEQTLALSHCLASIHRLQALKQVGQWGKMIYFIINLTKYIQDLYADNYKTLMKEIKEDLLTIFE